MKPSGSRRRAGSGICRLEEFLADVVAEGLLLADVAGEDLQGLVPLHVLDADDRRSPITRTASTADFPCASSTST